MPRKQVYLILSKAGLTKDEQMKFIRKVVPAVDRQEIYVDDLTVPYRRKDKGLEQRELAIKQLRRGDSLVIATPGSLGVGRDDIRETLHRLSAAGCPVTVASSGKTILWTNAAAEAVEFLDAATLERRRGAAESARKARLALGYTYTPEPKPLSISEAEARQMWYDRIGHPSQKEVAERCGVSTRTLYNRFGSRAPSALARKKRGRRKGK